MKIGIATEETWDFLHEIYADLSAHHQTTLFKRREIHLPVLSGRANSRLFRGDMRKFMQANDAVFFEWASGLLATATQLPKTCGIVTRLHRYEMYQWADKINWNAVDTVILVSQAKYNEFAARFPEYIAKAVVIPEAVSPQRFQFVPKKFSGDIGILCHLKPRKRVYELILAFYELSKRRDDLHLHIGGGEAAAFGEYAEALRALVEKLGLREKITFYGHVSKPETWYPNIDIYISNGYSEGLQVSPMEAMATGCYALSHHWDGADELLPPENLFFSEAELIERIEQYCALSDTEHTAAREKMRALVVEKFNVDKTKVQIRQLIETAAERYSK